MSRPTFTIVEKSDDFDWEGFTKDYCEMKLSKKDLLEKYDLSESRYGTRVRQVKNETGFHRPRGFNPKRKFIHKRASGTYLVKKNVGSVRKQITVRDFQTAKKVLAILDENSWSDEVLYECREKYALRCGWKARGTVYSPVKTLAMPLYDEFKDLFFDGSLTVDDIKEKLGINAHQYNCLRRELKVEYPDLPHRLSIVNKVKVCQ